MTADGIGAAISALSDTERGVVVSIADVEYRCLSTQETRVRGNGGIVRISEGRDFVLSWLSTADLPAEKTKIISGGRKYVIEEIRDNRQFGGFIRLVCSYAPR